VLVRLCQEARGRTDAATIGFWRVAIATAILLPFALRSSGSTFPLPATHDRADPTRRETARSPDGRRLLERARAHPVASAVVAGVFLALHFVTWFLSLELTSIAVSTVLVCTVPLFSLALSALFLGERPSAAAVAGIGIATAGTLLLVGVDSNGQGARGLSGALLALAGAAFAAAYFVVGRAVGLAMPLARYLVLVNGSAAVSLHLLSAAAGGSWWTPGLPARPEHFLWIGAMAAGPHVLGHGLYNRAVRTIPAYVVSVVGLGEPALATAWAWWFFGERPGVGVVAGAATIFAGIAVALKGEWAATT
jgi:drug/metabolite transporter (DMT)-like permease